jgi:DeoR family transcriptional regulator, deoxyribose operon repressor
MPGKKRQDRITRILDMLLQQRGATIKELAVGLSVSEMTIRRDLELLAQENRIRLVHAGAIPAGELSSLPRAFSLADEDGFHAQEKERVGKKAASLVEAGDVIIVDSGSTAEWLARCLPQEMPLTILCFAMNILLEASRGAERSVVLAGGAMNARTLVFESPEGISLIRRHRANKAFLSAGGVSDTLGVTCVDPNEAELKKAAVASSQARILLADSSKIGKVTPSWFAELRDFDAIVTDNGVSLGFVEIVRDLGITLHVV